MNRINYLHHKFLEMPIVAKTASTSAQPTAAARTATAQRPAKAAPASKPTPAKKTPSPKAAKPATQPTQKPAVKLVRDSFTMPQQDFDLIPALKKRALALQRPAKKSELLRAGLHVLHRLPDESLLAALESLVQLKPGRPKKGA